MTKDQSILDNRGHTLVDYLRRGLDAVETFHLVSAYFSVYGYELLEEALNRVGAVRFLFGDPTSVEEVDQGRKEPKSFELTETGLAASHMLRQKAVARRCAEWIKRDTVEVRSISQANFLHGKMYIAGDTEAGACAVVGSSNFTRRGLGGGGGSNLEINLAVRDTVIRAELRNWFNALWSDTGLTRDVKEEVLNALGRIGQEHAPEFIYFKTLFELFRDEIDAGMDSGQQLADVRLYDTAIWKTLYAFQEDGAKSAIVHLMRHNGCILADSVGLGKTYTALAVIKYFELRNDRVLVLCPHRLRGNWSLYPVRNAQVDNPFADDRFGYTLLSHTDLSRNGGMAGDIDLSRIHWGGFDLVVIDESHNFRNDGGQRYRRLIDEIIEKGTRTKVLMLSATPVNTSLLDLRNQVYLMTAGRDDAFRESLGISSLRTAMDSAQKEFKAWETGQSPGQRRDKAQLVAKLGPEFLRLLDAVSIARSRRQIERFYTQEMVRIGRFPTHERPDNHYPPTDLRGDFSYRNLAEQIERFDLSVYQPSHYLTDEARIEEATQRVVANFSQQDRERFLIGMIRTNFLKRLESSPHSLALTLQRTIAKIDALLERMRRFENAPATDTGTMDIQPDEDEDDEDFVINRQRHSYHLRELDLTRWQCDLRGDRETLAAVLDKVASVTSDRDGKLANLKEIVRQRAANPTVDQDGRANRKMLVFTTFKDTAEYLYQHLHGLAGELGLATAIVAGDITRTTGGGNNFNAILTNFAPRARNRAATVDTVNIDLLIATDCISEGQNLQDCDTVLNYDIHWNPVRIIQRFGRIDRIGSRNDAVRMVNFWPTKDMEVYLRLENRVRARMALADIAASGDDDPLTEESAQCELKFRDEQLVKLRDDIRALEDLDDGPNMSDFTLDYFYAQLMRYLERHREELESIPFGAYAVAESNLPHAEPGVIFFLRQRSGGSAKRGQRMASPAHPFYLAVIGADGRIRLGCANLRQALDAFEAASAGKPEAILRLCDAFNAETDHGRNMARYDGFLNVVATHIAEAHHATQANGLGIGGNRDFVLPKESESPNDLDDFELVTWLVIRDPV